jgi:hypothetical protein
VGRRDGHDVGALLHRGGIRVLGSRKVRCGIPAVHRHVAAAEFIDVFDSELKFRHFGVADRVIAGWIPIALGVGNRI